MLLLVCAEGHFTPWPSAVTMKLWGTLKLTWTLYHGKLKLNFIWSRASKCSVKTHATGLSTKCFFITILLTEALLHIKSENQGLWDIEVPWSSGFVLDPHLWGGLNTKSDRPWNVMHFMPCRTSCRFVHPFKRPRCLTHLKLQCKVKGAHFPPIWDVRFLWSWPLKL